MNKRNKRVKTLRNRLSEMIKKEPKRRKNERKKVEQELENMRERASE